jgi:hypothetical protein
MVHKHTCQGCVRLAIYKGKQKFILVEYRAKTKTTTAHSQDNLHRDTYICITLRERNL